MDADDVQFGWCECQEDGPEGLIEMCRIHWHLRMENEQFSWLCSRSEDLVRLWTVG